MHPSVSLARPGRPARARAVLFAVSLAAGLAAQTTVAIPCDRDNTLYESATGTLSNGRGQCLFAGLTGQPARRRALLHFDVAAHVPAGARIVAATLTVSVTRTAIGSPTALQIHRVLANWGEGTSNASGQEGRGTTATTNDATWLHAFYPGTFWSTPGGDFAAAESCSMPMSLFGPASSPPAAGMIADVQSWLDHPPQNFGWLLTNDELVPYIAYRYDSREAPVGGAPPVLTVRWLLPGQAAANIGQGCPVSGSPFTFALSGLPLGGTTVVLAQSNGPPGSLAANLLALSFDPAGSPLLPQCPLLLPPGGMVTQGIVTLDNAGAASTPYALLSGYAGVLLAGQSAALDPGSPQGFVLSNAWVAVLN
jgi:hypothetical protein